jgi:hypothetical protein
VRKDTLPASPSGEYLFTRSKLGRPASSMVQAKGLVQG